MKQPVGYLIFTLHSHLPFVLNHGRWPFGSDWLSEAAVQSYLPLLRSLTLLADEDVIPTVTITLSPILCEQLANPGFGEEITAFLQQRLEACRDNRRHFADTGEDHLAALCDYWQSFYQGAQAQLETLGGDLLGAFRRLADREAIELITCAATHGYLPLLSRDESLDLQMRVAVATHTRHFGHAPHGVWLPECAYRPRYEWTPPVGPRSGKVRYRRRGVEEVLADHGLAYFFTDIHLVRGGRGISAYGDYFPSLRTVLGPEPHNFYRRGERTPYTPYVVASRGGTGQAVAFVRDPETTLQVWSRDVGYPGDEWYLDFHKIHFPGGLRFWRVTHPKIDLADKQVYDPRPAAERTRAQAEHYVGIVREILSRSGGDGEAPAVLCSPFDTELFGHWWYEGPQWLARVFERLAAEQITPLTAGQYLAKHPPHEAITLLEGSWGEGGDHRVWMNRDTEWTWEMIYEAEETFWTFVAAGGWQRTPLLRRIVEQMGRELLLLQGSDWQFLITTWAARSYAETRFAEHCANLTRLLDLAKRVAGGGSLTWEDEQFLKSKEVQDFCFPVLAGHLEAAAQHPHPA
ncbi:MAG TPA: 1,4-alpha-glucan branching protein domain-containing protein [bacterium]|nr:1,4-alpha-glucan branching protein domain-containing protein [bacterium]